MKLNIKKIAGGIGAVILGMGGLIAAGKSGFCENLGKSEDNGTPEPKEEPAAEPAPAAETVEAEEVSDNGEEQ